MAHVVAAFLRNRGELLLVRRSDAASSYPGRWGGVAGYATGDAADPLADAVREVREETGVAADDLTLVRRGDPVDVDGPEGSFTVHPFLFDCATRSVRPSEELAAVEWVRPPAMLARETVPRLWDAYRAVGPTVETVAADRTHGSAAVSVRALEALRDAAAAAAADDADDGWEGVAAVARALRDARPGMTALATRVNRVMHEAARTPGAVRDRASDAVGTAAGADERAAREAVRVLRGHGDAPAVLTLSRSGTVAAALAALDGPVFVAESRPGGEGREAAASLAADGEREVTLVPDSAVASLLADGAVDAALVGADAVFPDGSVANKVGTRGLALAAAREGVPVYAATARDKVAPGASSTPSGPRSRRPRGWRVRAAVRPDAGRVRDRRHGGRRGRRGGGPRGRRGAPPAGRVGRRRRPRWKGVIRADRLRPSGRP
nr:NUDIX domain-containing protein [Halobaculum sp. DT92]